MAHPLTDAHIVAQARLRRIVERAVRTAWTTLPGYDEEHVPDWLATVVPVVAVGQRQSVALTDAYLARILRRSPLGLTLDETTGAAVRAGAAPDEVYRRPFVTVWTALKAGTAWQDAVNAGLARAASTATMDVQLAHRAALQAAQDRDTAIFGYRRAADADACQFCQTVDGAYVKSAGAMPLHNGCGCGLEPLTEPHRLAARLPSGVAVHEHGELGPVLADPAHDFATV
jgi:hypothetical protein